MSDWGAVLSAVDDDYLVGISNKGILKRAYKDKEEGGYRVVSADEEAVVEVGGETVRIRNPLAESQCSCPSRSICRHVVLGIIVLKEEFAGGKAEVSGIDERTAGVTGTSEVTGTLEMTGVSEMTGASEVAGMSEMTGMSEIAEASEGIGAGAGKSGTGSVVVLADEKVPNVAENGGMLEALESEIDAYPLQSLKKVIGVKQIQNIVGQIKSGEKPEIVRTSIITVRFPRQDMTVKLISPLEYSSCTCHKKEMCIHKAAAILWCQIEDKVVSVEGLVEGSEDGPSFAIENVKAVARQMREFIEELLNTGLSRTSPDLLDYMERLAIICHNAELARFEGYWRSLRAGYEKYMKRAASFKAQKLVEQLTRLYCRAGLLMEAGDSDAVAALAGEFRSEYMPVGRLDLLGIAMESFVSGNGYAGETVYFLEQNTKEWYTYTAARPTFYDSSVRKRRPQREQAPWGLPIPIGKLSIAKIHLTGAKCDSRKRLSSSQDTKGEYLGERTKVNRLGLEDIKGWYYDDFARLFEEQISAPKNWLKEQDSDSGQDIKLVFVQPEYCEKAYFSETEQRLFMNLYDKMGRELIVEVEYSQKESGGIRYLERITNEKLPCFLGKLYMRDGRMRMYPITVFEKEELDEDGI